MQLVLNDTNITADQDASIYCGGADKLIITLAGGTDYTVTDASSFTYADTVADEPDAAIFSKVDLTLNGSGFLIVNANYDNGIGTKDDPVVAGGNDSGTGGRFGNDKFSAVSTGQRLKITGRTITVIAGADGIDINGNGEITGGTVDVTAAALGEGNTIDCDGSFNRTGGTLAETGGNSIGGGKKIEDDLFGIIYLMML